MIRSYQAADKQRCLEIFNSNCPKYFDRSEYVLFEKWLEHQGGNAGYSSPTYKNAEFDAYYVIADTKAGIVACGGFYIVKEEKEARLAWGMVHADFHKKGYGTQLYKHRAEVIARDWPAHTLTLGTSQHTFPFYQKMGMNVTQTIKSGYGAELDRYDMTKQ